jgi:subtilisin-like proprotein convertase family protein/Ca2+-binding RTX toxin-like protein
MFSANQATEILNNEVYLEIISDGTVFENDEMNYRDFVLSFNPMFSAAIGATSALIEGIAKEVGDIELAKQAKLTGSIIGTGFVLKEAFDILSSEQDALTKLEKIGGMATELGVGYGTALFVGSLLATTGIGVIPAVLTAWGIGTLASAGAGMLYDSLVSEGPVGSFDMTDVISPVIIDLDGDGVIEHVNLSDSATFFDIDGDGFLENTGWVGADDGLLVIDLATDGTAGADGNVTNADEFVFTRHAEGATGDLEALALAFDDNLSGNGDGKLDGDDSRWDEFRVWRDLDQDGETDAGELKTLADWGITSIDLNGVPVVDTTGSIGPKDNVVTNLSTHSDGAGMVGDIDFVFSTFGYQWDDTATNGIKLNAEDEEDILYLDDDSSYNINLGASGYSGVFGANQNDTLTAGNALDVLIDGGTGNDILSGGSGDDWISGGDGADSLSSGAGHDVLFVDVDDIGIDGGADFDVAIYTGTLGATLDLGASNIEAVYGNDGDDNFSTTGTDGVQLDGAGGNDTLTGGVGVDLLVGGIGADSLSGGAGDDTLFIDVDDVLINGGDGYDVAYVSTESAVTLDASTSNLEAVFGNAGDDIISTSGVESVMFSGYAGNDTLTGGSGDDVLIGGIGSDTLDGGGQAVDGADTAVYLGLFSDYQITSTGGSTYTVTDKKPELWGDEGVDTLSGIERLQFADRTLYLDGTNNAPIAEKWDWAKTFKDTGVLITASELLANDGDFDGDGLSLTAVGNAQHGSVGLDAGGDAVFVPESGFTGRARFDYTVSDGNGGEATSTAYVTVQGELPTDTYFSSQWHHDAIHSTEVWEDYTGEGVTVGVWDDGVDYTHEDLDDNYNTATDWDFTDGDADPFPVDTNGGDAHGTAVSGVIAGERNGMGVVGIAYDAEIAGIRGNGSTGLTWGEVTDSLSYLSNFDVVYGYGSNNPFQENIFNTDYPGYTYIDDEILAMENALVSGRGGLGTVAVFSGGNWRSDGFNNNYSNRYNSRHATAVGSIEQDFEYATYSAPGSSLLVTAPGQYILTTDAGTPFGYTDYDFIGHNGTSASGPVGVGVATLIVDANPLLGARDVQEIMALSATQVDEDVSGYGYEWSNNGAANWNGGGMHTSHIYGFGLVDARAATRLAETWTTQNTFNNEQSITTGTITSGQAIADLGETIETTTVVSNLVVDNVEVEIDLNHTNIGDLVITLISPDGTESVLADRPGKNPDDPNDKGLSDASPYWSATEDYLHYRFTSTRHWGETGDGVWTLKVQDTAGNDTGTLNSWNLTLYGDTATADDTYLYTDEYAGFTELADTDRRTLSDDDGGVDTINAAAVTSDVLIDLNDGAASWIADNTLTIASGTVIENVYAGDGDDWLIGSGVDNRLSGGRGDDVLVGGAGADNLDGGAGTDTVSYGGSALGVTVNLSTGMGTGGDADGDVLSDIENLSGSAFNDVLTGNAGDNTLNGGAGDDSVDFDGLASGYAWSFDSDENTWSVTDQDASDGDTGTDSLSNIELALFNDASVGLGSDGTTLTATNGVIQTPIDSPASWNLTAAGGSGGLIFTYEGTGTLVDSATALALGFSGLEPVYETTNGYIQIQDTGAYDYKPAAGHDGMDSFDFRVTDASGLASVATMDITVGTEVVVAQALTGGTAFGNATFGGGLAAAFDGVSNQADGASAKSADDVTAQIGKNWGTGNAYTVTGYRIYGASDNGYDNDTTGMADVTVVLQGSNDGVSFVDLHTHTFTDANGTHMQAVSDGINISTTYRYHQVLVSNSNPYRNVVAEVEFDGYTGGIPVAVPDAGHGNDNLSGSTDADTIDGLGGDDLLIGDAGDDILTGGVGNDTLIGGAGNDSLDGGVGTDTVSYMESGSAVSVDLSTATVSGGDAAGDVLSNIESVEGSAFGDTLTGDNADNTLTGGQGDDVLDGGLGTDTAQFSGNYQDYAISVDAGGTVIVTDQVGTDGTDTISNVEKLAFANATLSVQGNTIAPLLVLDSVTTAEDTNLTVLASDLILNDVDVEGDSFAITSAGNGVGGTVSLDGSGDVVFSPDADFFGTGSFDYTVTDTNGATSTQTVAVDVTPVNDAPVTAGDTVNGTEDTPLSILASNLLSNDTDVDGVLLSIASVTDGTGGTVAQDANGNVIFTPTADFDGNATFTYTVSDGNGGSTDGNVTVALAGVNDAPTATGESVSGTEDVTTTILASDLLVNDTDVDGDALSITAVDNAAGGSVSLDGNGDVVFTPTADFNGQATFEYTISDGNGTFSSATATVDVASVNDAPIAVVDTTSTAQDTPVTVLAAALLANDTDIDGDTLTLTGVQNPVNGTVTLDGSGDVVFTPSTTYNGWASFEYTVSDGNGGTITGTANIGVGSFNTLPEATADSASATEDVSVTIDKASLLTNDTDIDGDTLSIQSVGNAVGGAVSLDGNGDVVFIPDADFNGTATFEYTASDGQGGTATTTVSVDVAAVNDGPTSVTDTASTSEDVPTTILAATLLANDSDVEDDALTITSVGNAVDGTVSLDGNGDVSFTPDADFNGSATFDYTVSDSNGGSATETVTVSVGAVNDAPVAVDGTVQVAMDGSASWKLAATDVDDVAGDLTFALETGPSNGAVVVNGDGTYTYTPTSSYVGADSFQYRVTDVGGLTSVATMDITVGTEVAVAQALTGGTAFGNATFGGGLAAAFDGVSTQTDGASAKSADDVTAQIGKDWGSGNAYTVTGYRIYGASDNGYDNDTTGMADVTVVLKGSNDGVSFVDLHTHTFTDANGTHMQAVSDGINISTTYRYHQVLVSNSNPYRNVVAEVEFDGYTGGIPVAAPAASQGNDSIEGSTDVDIIDGMGGDDQLTGNGGNDTLIGGAGDDTITGGDGNDILDGGTGTDTARYSSLYSNYSVQVPGNGTITVTDLVGNGGTDTLTNIDLLEFSDISITVDGLNLVPVAIDDTASTLEDTPLTILASDLLANDIDGNGDMITVTSVQNAANGTVSLDGNGDVYFVPDLNFFGESTFEYTITDGQGSTSIATATVFVGVDPVNDAPILTGPVSFNISEDQSFTITEAQLLANASDVENDPISATDLVLNGGQGSLVDNGDGTWTLTPGADWSGQMTLGYVVSDGDATVSASTTVDVASLNDTPIAAVDAASTAQDTPVTLLAATLLANDTDIDGDTLTLTGVQNPVNGTVTLDGNGDVVFTPSTAYNGWASFEYTVSDGNGGTITGTANIGVGSFNTLPEATADSASATEDVSVTIDKASLLTNDTDVDGDTLSIQSVGNAVGGAVSLDGNGDVVFIPDADFNGIATFEYTADDGQGGTASATVSVNVAAVNDGPTSVTDTASTSEDVPTTILAATLLANDTDIDGDTLIIQSVGNGVDGTVSLDGSGDVVFTPDADFNGSATFDYTVSDGNGGTATQTVTVNVGAVNDAPVAVDGMVQVAVDGSASWKLAATDVDDAAGDLTFALETGPSNGAVVVNGDGTYTYTPTSSYVGADSFQYRVTDAGGLTSVATMDVTVGSSFVDLQNLNVQALSGGTAFGNATFGGGLAAAFDGLSNQADGASAKSADDVTAQIGQDWGTGNAYTVTGYRIYGASDNGYDNDTTGMADVTVVLQGSIDGVSFVDLHTHTFTDANGTHMQAVSEGIEMSTAYRYHQVLVSNSNPYRNVVAELEFDGLTGGLPIAPPVASESNDSLEGSTDADTINGLGGDDLLIGGTGDDTYQFGRGDDQDLIDNHGEGASNDKVVFGANIDTDQLWFSHVGDDLVVQIIGTNDQATVDDWYTDGTANQVSAFETSTGTGSSLTRANVENLVSAMSAFSPPALGETDLAQSLHSSLDVIIAANWES